MSDKSEIKEFWEKRTAEFKEKAPVHIGKSALYNKLMTRAHRKELKKALESCKPELVLEIGVGQGRLLSRIEISQGIGIDLSKNMLKTFKKTSSPKIELIQAEATHLPFKSDCFGLVYTCTVLLHIPDTSIEEAILEIKRVASENIFIIEQLPNFEHINKPYSQGGYCFPHKYFELFQLKEKYRNQLKNYGHEAILFTKNSQEQKNTKNGFEKI
jgi:ubiquinone/menaquinone biosynthesis C-methylase UbiE